MDFIQDNAMWLTPVLVAIVSGIFYLIKKGGNSNKQTIKNIHNSKINQSNGNLKDESRK